MYYPKSQIQSDLYTNGGEYYYLGTTNEYVGNYFVTGDNKTFTGRNPSDKPNQQLTLISPNLDPEVETSLNYYLGTEQYLNAKGESSPNFNTPPPLPTQIFPQPTEENYKVGEFQRYFLKRTNEIKYLEVSQSEYKKYLNNELNVNSELYLAFSLPWLISGSREEAYKVNQKTVERVSKNLNLVGFPSYFKQRYDQLYKSSENN